MWNHLGGYDEIFQQYNIYYQKALLQQTNNQPNTNFPPFLGQADVVATNYTSMRCKTLFLTPAQTHTHTQRATMMRRVKGIHYSAVRIFLETPQ